MEKLEAEKEEIVKKSGGKVNKAAAEQIKKLKGDKEDLRHELIDKKSLLNRVSSDRDRLRLDKKKLEQEIDIIKKDRKGKVEDAKNHKLAEVIRAENNKLKKSIVEKSELLEKAKTEMKKYKDMHALSVKEVDGLSKQKIQKEDEKLFNNDGSGSGSDCSQVKDSPVFKRKVHDMSEEDSGSDEAHNGKSNGELDDG